MIATIMKVERVRAKGKKCCGGGFLYKHGRGISGFASHFLVYAVVILFMVQKSTAFAPSKTHSLLGISRHRIKNHTSATTNRNGTEEIKDGSRSGSSRSSIAEAFAVAHQLLFYPVQRTRFWNKQVRNGYQRRINADPSFFGKSIVEVLVAAGTQLMAEWNRRGASRMVSELDFVVPAVLTAVFGKYYRCVPLK